MKTEGLRHHGGFVVLGEIGRIVVVKDGCCNTIENELKNDRRK
jgi:hypothetical protein